MYIFQPGRVNRKKSKRKNKIKQPAFVMLNTRGLPEKSGFQLARVRVPGLPAFIPTEMGVHRRPDRQK
jgi:hypothetical protein